MDWNTIIVINSVVVIIAGTLVKIFGSRQKTGCRDCFQAIQQKLEDHESRITVSETEIKGIFKTLEDIKDDLKEILRLLRGDRP